MARILNTRITKLGVDRLLPGLMIRDTDLAGFGVRRQKSAPTYFLQKRIGRRVRWIIIGRHGCPWTPDSARKEAYRLLGQIVGGDEPRLKRQDLTDKPTLADAAQRFIAEHGLRLEPPQLSAQIWSAAFQVGNELPLFERLRDMVVERFDEVGERCPLAGLDLDLDRHPSKEVSGARPGQFRIGHVQSDDVV